MYQQAVSPPAVHLLDLINIQRLPGLELLMRTSDPATPPAFFSLSAYYRRVGIYKNLREDSHSKGCGENKKNLCQHVKTPFSSGASRSQLHNADNWVVITAG